ncbi:thiol-disulfide oxidoreductase DCC family protein [Comamonas testosteroni]|uniref:Thiol-disulfide oxidoreductase DCC family protein n=1 Tax=Comamonas testosteroni TaxID=285 RepID=A0A373FB97_COMTE|nr:thiol-disulfide oxidoreductase DCC family protein [Comamonas testosteroni]RGE41424.1 thiol-disulfide oxidoreductase DCC family protein [Comamonas testosteroni]
MIVVFDAQCLLCNGWVQFLLKHDKQGIFQFAAIQGKVGGQLLADAGLKVEGLQTLLLVDGKQSWQHTDAILRVLQALGWPWRLVGVARLIPAPLRDALYRVIARNRYQWFGKSEQCLMPDPAVAARFLD